jgi:hypothetical protein
MSKCPGTPILTIPGNPFFDLRYVIIFIGGPYATSIAVFVRLYGPLQEMLDKLSNTSLEAVSALTASSVEREKLETAKSRGTVDGKLREKDKEIEERMRQLEESIKDKLKKLPQLLESSLSIVQFESYSKIIIVETSILSVAIVLDLMNMLPILRSPLVNYIVNLIFFAFTGAVISGLFYYLIPISKKESRFYRSKYYLIIALFKEDIFEQMCYFGAGPQEYNKYLKRRLKHQIKDIDTIFSKVSLLDNDNKREIIHLLCKSFLIESDKLKPIKYISSEVMKSDIKDFLIPESLKSQLKVLGAFLGIAVPIVISIITLYLTLTKPHTTP